MTVKLRRPSQVLVYGGTTGSAPAAASSIDVAAGVGQEPGGSNLAEQTVTGDATIGGATTLSLPAGRSEINLYVDVVGGGPFEVSEGPTPTELTVLALPALAG